MVFSPTLAARSAICVSVTGNPRAVMFAVTVAAGPVTLTAKYSPGCIAHAAMSAMMPTHISMIIAP